MTGSRAATAPRPVTPASILASLLDGVVRELDTAELDPSLRARLHEVRELASGLDPYLARWTTPESPALADLARATAAVDWGRGPDGADASLEQEMLSGHIEGQLLKMLVHATRARHVLEIGMFTGYSALAMAEALPPDGQVVACEIDTGVAAFARRHFDETPDGHKIVVRVGPASQSLDELAALGVRFDLVFIDADKAGYAGYLGALLEHDMVEPHGLICVDNTLMQGQPWRSGESTVNGLAVAEFNRAVAADPRVEQVIVPLRDGVTLIRRVDQHDPL